MQTEATRAGVHEGLRRRLWRLIAGRAVVFSVLLLLAPRLGALAQGAPRWLPGVRALSLVALTVSLAYALVLRFTRLGLVAQASVQVALDILLVSWLVVVSGDLHSPFAALYIVVISVASITLGVRATLVSAVGCAFAYTSVMCGLGFGWFGAGVEPTSLVAVAGS